MQYLLNARQNMIKGQILPLNILDNSIIEAMSKIPRHAFLPENMRDVAYTDTNILLGNGRYLLSPATFARLLVAARITKSDRVLDVGCLGGYSSAIIASLASEVIATESDETFASLTHNVLNKKHINNVIIVRSDLNLGHPSSAPYQVIVINGSIPKVPDNIINQLDIGGRLVTIIQENPYIGKAVLIEKNAHSLSTKVLFEENIPNLLGFSTM